MSCTWQVGGMENPEGRAVAEGGPNATSAWSLVFGQFADVKGFSFLCFLSLKGPPDGISFKVPQSLDSLLVCFP